MDVSHHTSSLATSSSIPPQAKYRRLKPLSLKASLTDLSQRRKRESHDGCWGSRLRAAGAACWTWLSTKCADAFILDMLHIDDILPDAQQPLAAKYSVVCTDGLDLTVVFHY